MINIFALSGFLNGIFGVVFGTFVFLSKPRKLANRTFGLMSLSLAVWSFSYGLWLLSTDRALALFWVHCLSLGSTFIPITFLHWVLATLNLQQRRRGIIIGGYALSVILSLFSFSSLYIKSIEPKLSFFWWPQPGILYTAYIFLVYLGVIAYALFELLKAYRNLRGYPREQIKYILLAIVVGFGGGATNFPLWYGIPLPPYGNFLVFLYPLLLSYAILRYRLMNIKIVIAELFVGLIVILLFINFIISKAISEYLWEGAILVAFVIFGFLLIKSVMREIKQKEQINQYAQDLAKANSELKIAYSKLQVLDKTKSDFISIASHQLRTPLTAIKGYVSMFLEGDYGKLNGKAKKSMENIFQANERLIGLVNSLLDLSRIEAGKIKLEPSKVNLKTMLESMVVDFSSRIANKKIKIIFESQPANIPAVQADEKKIREVFSNLIDNAIKYTNEGLIKVELKAIHPYLRVVVADTGIGMAQEEINGLFNSFSRGREGKSMWVEGAGLGLYVAKKFIEMHHGRIWAESEGKGKGSKFIIELPITQTT